MKIDGGIGVDGGFDRIVEKSQEQEEIGYDGLWVPETSHDPFTMLPLMAHGTKNIELGTSIVVGFARNPMDLAYSANDIQLISKGRFTLGSRQPNQGSHYSSVLDGMVQTCRQDARNDSCHKSNLEQLEY